MAETIGLIVCQDVVCFFVIFFLMREVRKQAKNGRFVEMCRTIVVETWGKMV